VQLDAVVVQQQIVVVAFGVGEPGAGVERGSAVEVLLGRMGIATLAVCGA
jgi:hypothetical protein